MSQNPGLGLSGRLAAIFLDNPLTPILALAGLLLGLVAVLVTPREEEPQIDVTMADVIVPFPGAEVGDVEQLVAYPLEQLISEIEGIEHVWSVSRPGVAMVTVQFKVGEKRRDALVRLYNQVYSSQDWVPAKLGVGQPLIRPMGIDDVPVMSLTLWAADPSIDALALAEVAHSLEAELKRVPGTRDVYTIGAPERAVLITFDPTLLAAFDLTVEEVRGALQQANVVLGAGDRVSGNESRPLTAGRFLADAEAVRQLVIGLNGLPSTRSGGGDPVFLADVARIEQGGDLPRRHAWHGSPPGAVGPAAGSAPAVTLAIAKKPGSNAGDITRSLRERIESLRGLLIPHGVEVEISRDYGQTADAKADQLISKLVFATASVVLLVLFSLGRREAIVVGSAVVLTLALTLFASLALGFTINRVSLFALIFSIGILVDDAIVVVENIHRHQALGKKSLREAIPLAVAEVGGPTILATFTVIAALLPMAFVSGLMGPYMRPIPINASAGMLLSLLVALIVTPWMSLKLLGRHVAAAGDGTDAAAPSRLQRFFERLLRPFLRPQGGARRRWLLFGATIALVLASASLALFQLVVLKMLPLDNKSEFQVVLDMPEGSTLEHTDRVLRELATVLDGVSEVASYQGYVGTAAPINFNGLVRQYYLREGPNVADLQVNLVAKGERSRQSHDIARAVRPALAEVGNRYGASVKVVEVPPGPPVLAPVVAEVYGPDPDHARALALRLQQRFAATEGLVDIDTSVETVGAERDIIVIDRARAARRGVSQAAIAQSLRLALSGEDASYLMDGRSKYALPLRLRLDAANQAEIERLLGLKVRAADGSLVPLTELVRVESAGIDQAIFHKDLRPVVYVTADEASTIDSPLYGMFKLVAEINRDGVDGQPVAQYFISQPIDQTLPAIKWDGEWQITYETFRDMGIAYSVGLVLIYLLVVGQFRSYVVPLIIMAPIPLTVIGVMPGHALLGAQFTATSMIGMIALAGIIVRNSILLVDFIDHARAEGRELADAVIEAVAVRAKPIVLTGAAAMLGAFFILDDPIFNGLAVALIFGILVSTALTLVLIPLLYYAWLARQTAR